MPLDIPYLNSMKEGSMFYVASSFKARDKQTIAYQ